jgi:hypothetical protein
MSASPVLQSFSLILAAVKPSAANRNRPSFSLSQPRGPLQLPDCSNLAGIRGGGILRARSLPFQ